MRKTVSGPYSIGPRAVATPEVPRALGPRALGPRALGPLSVASTEATRRPSVAATEATCTGTGTGTGTGRAVRGKSGGTAAPFPRTHTQDRYPALRGDNLRPVVQHRNSSRMQPCALLVVRPGQDLLLTLQRCIISTYTHTHSHTNTKSGEVKGNDPLRITPKV